MKELFETNFMASIVMIDIASQSVLEFWRIKINNIY